MQANKLRINPVLSTIIEQFHLEIPVHFESGTSSLFEERDIIEDLADRAGRVVLANAEEEVISIEPNDRVVLEERVHMPRDAAELVRRLAVSVRVGLHA